VYKEVRPPSSRVMVRRVERGLVYFRWEGWADWTIKRVRTRSSGERSTVVKVWEIVVRINRGRGFGE